MINHINYNYLNLYKFNGNRSYLYGGKPTKRDSISFGNITNITSEKTSVCKEIIYEWLLCTTEPSKNIFKRTIENIIIPLGVEKYSNFLASGNNLISFAVKEKDNIVGGVIGNVDTNNLKDRKLELCFLFLDKKYQRTKIGRKILINLFQNIKDFCEKNNIDSISWSTNINNKKAVNLYNKITIPKFSDKTKLNYNISLSEMNTLSENTHFKL